MNVISYTRMMILNISTINPLMNKLITMRKILIVLLIISSMIISCKTAQKAVTAKPSENPPVEKAADINNEQDKVSATENKTPIFIKTEEVTIAKDEDQSRGGYAFYVIVGSFLKPENAGKFRIQLINEDFSPVLLNAKSGYIRVAVEQTNSEAEAQQIINNIRENYPKYKDVWMLKNQ